MTIKWRHILPIALAKLTKKPRYFPEFEWSTSWVYNTFRVFEQIFGREYGIRREAIAGFRENEIVYQFFTIEAFLAYTEGEIRAWFKSWKWVPVEIWVPVLATAGQTARLPQKKQGYLFAIARDTSGSFNPGSLASGSTLITYTVTGANPFIATCFADNTNTTNDLTGVTYNAVAMTAGQTFTTGTRPSYLYYLPNPATGAHALANTFTNGPKSYQGTVASYSGVSSGALDNTNFTSDANCATNTHSITPIAASCWAITAEANPDALPAASTGANLVISAQGSGFFDSNGVATAGVAYSMTITVSGGTRAGMWSMFTIAPPTVAPSGGTLTLLGV